MMRKPFRLTRSPKAERVEEQMQCIFRYPVFAIHFVLLIFDIVSLYANIE